MPGKLSIVATPIGNLEDMTLRGIRVLRECDLIACEDTRVTSKLLAAYDISKPLRSLHEHSKSGQAAKLLDEVRQGKHVCYVSDAGTPGMNDPGGRLVAEALESGLSVEAIPGPSALTAAISVCGFPMDDFTYLGFAPHKKGRKTFFEELAARTIPSVFLESTHRIEKALDALEVTLQPTRLVFVGRELTKLHEMLYRGTIAKVKQGIAATSTKGEFTVIVGPAPKG
jgi:16S rRNA (cytidine1402-2'-O)-methyltransferase